MMEQPRSQPTIPADLRPAAWMTFALLVVGSCCSGQIPTASPSPPPGAPTRLALQRIFGGHPVLELHASEILETWRGLEITRGDAEQEGRRRDVVWLTARMARCEKDWSHLVQVPALRTEVAARRQSALDRGARFFCAEEMAIGDLHRSEAAHQLRQRAPHRAVAHLEAAILAYGAADLLAAELEARPDRARVLARSLVDELEEGRSSRPPGPERELLRRLLADEFRARGRSRPGR